MVTIKLKPSARLVEIELFSKYSTQSLVGSRLDIRSLL
jgi:hypothetical protein